MKKTNKIKKIAVTMMAAVCALSPLAAISASAASDYTQKKSVKLTNGYTVKATLVTNTAKANAKFEVTNGGATDLAINLSVKYTDTKGNLKTYKNSVSKFSAYVNCNMNKPKKFAKANKVEASYINAYVPSTYSNHTIGLYKYI